MNTTITGSTNTETKTFKIKTTPKLMRRLERFFALLDFNSKVGHSNLFGMPLDGDGSEKIEIDGLDKRLFYEVDCIGGVGCHLEVANDDCYSCYFLDKDRNDRIFYQTGPAANLYKGNEVIKTIPSFK